MPPVKGWAQKYRPQKLSQVAGQKSIVTTFRGNIEKGEIPSAYLLTGPSGCGKTTIGRLIAKYLNCTEMTGCGKCDSCVALQEGRHPDIEEFNMADSRKIEDVRNLIARSRFMSTHRLRVFILDECFPPDAEVEVAPDQWATIEDICQNPDRYPEVLSYDTKVGRIEAQPVISRTPKEAKPDQMVRVDLEDGSHQDCTDTHKWWSVTRGRMVEAQELLEGEELLVRD